MRSSTHQFRLLLFLSLGFLLIVGILYSMSNLVLKKSFLALEEEDLIEHAHRVEDSILADLSNLDGTAGDWANWDDPYKFALGENPAFIGDALGEAVFTNLDINVMLILNNRNKILYQAAYDLEAGRVTEFPNSLIRLLLEDHPLLEHGSFESSHAGILRLADGPMLVAARPILTTNSKGPAAGTLILGRWLDEQKLRDISELTHLEISLLDPSLGSDPAIQEIVSGLGGRSQWIKRLDEENIAVYAWLQDTSGKPYLIIETKEQRDIYLRGRDTIHYFMSWIIGIGLITLGVYYVGLNRFFTVEREKRKAETTVIDTEKKYRRLVEDVPAITYMATLKETFEFTYISPQVEMMLGFTPQELLQDATFIQKCLYAADQERVFTEIIGCLQQRKPYQLEYRVLRRDNEILWVRDETTLIEAADGSGIQIQGVLLDITDRVKAEQETRQQAARAQALLRVANRINFHRDLENVLEAVCEETRHVLNVPIASVYLVDPRKNELYPVASAGVTGSQQEYLEPISRALYDYTVSQSGSTVVIPDLQSLSIGKEKHEKFHARTLAFASLLHENALLGILSVLSIDTVQEFSKEDLELLTGLASQASIAIANARAYSESKARLEQLHSLRRIDQTISTSFDLKISLDVVLSQVEERLSVNGANILLFNPNTRQLELKAWRGRHPDLQRKFTFVRPDSPAGQAVFDRRTIFLRDIQALLDQPSRYDRAKLQDLLEQGVRGYLALPLISKGQVQGVMEIFQESVLDPDAQWLDFLETLAGQAAIAVDNALLFEGLQRKNFELSMAYDTTLEGWSRALDLRDEDTEGHSQRVTDMTLQIARRMGIAEVELVHLRRGALLHDMGKMGIPDRILHKAGPLDDEEWVAMRKHPVYAFDLLSPIHFLRPALDIPHYHHERWDGSGYPVGLKGEEIPLSARIFAVADVWDALTSNRPYRKAWDPQRAKNYILEAAGSHFDPTVVNTFQELMDDPQRQKPDKLRLG